MSKPEHTPPVSGEASFNLKSPQANQVSYEIKFFHFGDRGGGRGIDGQGAIYGNLGDKKLVLTGVPLEWMNAAYQAWKGQHPCKFTFSGWDGGAGAGYASLNEIVLS